MRRNDPKYTFKSTGQRQGRKEGRKEGRMEWLHQNKTEAGIQI